jgi:hypothetical protein
MNEKQGQKNIGCSCNNLASFFWQMFLDIKNWFKTLGPFIFRLIASPYAANKKTSSYISVSRINLFTMTAKRDVAK